MMPLTKTRIVIGLLFLILLVGVVSADTLMLTPSADGDISRLIYPNMETFSVLRNGVGTDADSTNIFGYSALVAGGTTNTYINMIRGVFIFDTQGLPDDATVTSATLNLYQGATSTGIPPQFGDRPFITTSITNFATGGSGFQGIVPASFNQVGGTRFSTDKRFYYGINLNYYSTYILNPTGLSVISPYSPTGYAVRTDWDIDNIEPSSWYGWKNSWIEFHTSKYGADSTPQLIISYTVPAPALPAPTVSSISPSTAFNTAPVSVTITGLNFVATPDVYLHREGFPTIAATGETWVSSSSLTCTLPITAYDVGPWNVIVINPDSQTGTLSGGFTIQAYSPPPTPTTLFPSSGYDNTTAMLVAITGTYFQSGAHVHLYKSGETNITEVITYYVDSTHLNTYFNINGKATGAWDVWVTNPDGRMGTIPGGFTILSSVAPTPPLYINSWCWTYKLNGVGTAIPFGGNEPYPNYTFINGNYTVHLNVTDNTGAYNRSPQVTWINSTVPTPPTPGPTPVEIYANVLLHFNDINGSTDIFDEMGKTWYASGNDSYITTEVPYFGSGSLTLNKSVIPDVSGNYIWSPVDSDFDLLNGDFTIDFWVNVTRDVGTNNMNNYALFSDYDGERGYVLYYSYVAPTTYRLQFYDWATFAGGPVDVLTYDNTTMPLPAGEWHHIAVIQSNTTTNYGKMRLYLDGVYRAETIRTTPFSPPTSSFAIGQIAGVNYAPIKVDEFRLVKGYARWLANFTPETTEGPTYQWTYSVPGTYTWTCPANVTSLDIEIIGGGGSGRAGGTLGIAAGTGGLHGEYLSEPSFTVVPSQTYSITIGTGGATSIASTTSNAGGASSALGYSAAGGAGGITSTFYTTIGTAGENGYLIGGNAEAGLPNGAAAGIGLGAGGGGGNVNYTGQPINTGGRGSDGYVRLAIHGYSSNTADFSADPTTIVQGTNVHFTDTSIIHDTENLEYLWDFGDGSASTNSSGGATHVYSYLGTYDVSLTLTSSNSQSSTETKVGYITVISGEPTTIDLKTEPRDVTFHLVEGWGTAVPDVSVTIQGVSTSTGNWDWIVTLLGIPLDQVAINGTSMTQTTDSQGNAEFLMIPTAKYTVNFTKSGYTIPDMVIIPTDTQYVIYATNNVSWYGAGNNTLTRVNITVSALKVNSTFGAINITYDDTSMATTGGTVSVYSDNLTRGGLPLLIGSFPITSNFTNFSVITQVPQGGSGYIVQVNANNAVSETGAVNRSFTTYFKGSPVAFAGFDSTILLWVALFIIIFTAMFAGATQAPQVAVIICIEAWVFWIIGWLDPLTTYPAINAHGGGDALMVVWLSFATFVAIVWNFREGKKKEKGT